MEEYKKEKSKITTYKCNVCRSIFRNEEQLRLHVLYTKHYYKKSNILVEDE
jgi:hypothetical protein